MNGIHELYALEKLSGGDTFLHRLNPVVKLLSALGFILVVVSFDRYSLSRLFPYVFYSTLITAFSQTPYRMLLKRFIPALPFCLLAGLSGIIYDKAPAFRIGGLIVSYGTASFLSILLRSYLCVMAVLILVSVTRLKELTDAMRFLRIPAIFVTIFEMTYRYIGVLFGEAHSMYIAYTLRSKGAKGVSIGDMGGFAGQLLIRGFDRAQRVYAALKCRGYDVNALSASVNELTIFDLAFLIASCSFFVVFRLVNVNAVLARAIGGLV